METLPVIPTPDLATIHGNLPSPLRLRYAARAVQTICKPSCDARPSEIT